MFSLNRPMSPDSPEESNCASNETQLSFCLDLLVLLDVVKGCSVKVDPDKSKVRLNWNLINMILLDR